MAYNNPIMDLIRGSNNQVNTDGLLGGANRMFTGGFNSFEKVANDLDQVNTNRAVKQLLSNVDMNNPYSAISNLMGIRGVTAEDANNLMSPYIDRLKQENLDNYRTDSLAETSRHNSSMEGIAGYKAMKDPTANTKIIEDVNPYTGAKSFYRYDAKQSKPVITPVNLGKQSAIDTTGSSTMASNDSGIQLPTQGKDNGSTSNVGAYAANYVEQADTNPLDVSGSGSQVAGNVRGAGVNALPSTSNVTYSEPDRWGVSRGTDGTFKEANGNYVIPMNLREVKKVTLADGSTSYVVINKATGKDASGNVVGDKATKTESLIDIPVGNGQTQKYVQIKNGDGTITLKPLEIGEDNTIIKEPTLVDKDKQFIDTYGSDIDAVKRINESFGNTGIWGPMDYLTGKIGQLLPEGTPGGLGKEGREQSIVASDLANLKIAAQEAIKGVPSDKDTKTLELSIPSISDQPEVARQKMAQFQQKLGRINARKVQRLSNSNPSVANQMYKRMHNGDIPVPYGYDLDLTDGKYSLVKEK